jgi:hypothetical protein
VAAVLRLLLALSVPALAAAQPVLRSAPPDAPEEPETHAFRYSDYEEATIAGALGALGLEPDPAPEGKRVASVHLVRLEVVEVRDPAPRLLNVFHVVTRERVVERESLLHPGEPFRRTLADETRRNLSALPQLSLVLVVAALGDAADETRTVVITKDVWSLRLNWDVALTSGGVERLSLAPSETNVFGTHQRLGLLADVLPESYALGASYGVPRLGDGHVTLAVEAGLSFHRGTGAREGSFGSAQLVRPLWSSRTEWSWSASAGWLDEVTRLYSRGRAVRFALDPGTDCARAPTLCVPWAWRTETASTSASVTRSFGWAVKHDLTFGAEARRSRYTVPDPASYDAATIGAFEATRVPVGEDRVYPFARWRTYTNDFLRVLDLETLALQEDHRVGPEASVTVYPVLRALGSTRDLVGLSAELAFSRALGDGLARASAETTNEVRLDGGGVADGSVRGGLRLASPRGRLGRLVLDAVLVDRYENHLRRLSALGGDTRLRGWPTQYLLGSRALAANLELRSRPVQLLQSLQLGAAAFYDVGDAFDRWHDVSLHHSAGLGARVLFPQLDRTVFRIDVGFPIARALPAGVAPVDFVATFGQAFSP